MSFKNLNDTHRRSALVPFLEMSEHLEGSVVAVAVRKNLQPLTAGKEPMNCWKERHGLRANWDWKTFEQMASVAHFFSLLLSVWSSPGMNVSWITDDDNIVANDSRLDDMQEFSARISTMYLKHALGEFMMNTVAVDTQERDFEDYLAIPDLAAGMLSEVLSTADSGTFIRSPGLGGQKVLSDKSEIIADWFWHSSGSLKKACILIDRVSPGKFGVGKLNMGQL